MKGLKGFLKLGKGLFGLGNKEVTKNDILIVNSATSTNELINNGEDGVNPFISANNLANDSLNKIITAGDFVWLENWEFIGTSYTFLIRGKTYKNPVKKIILDDAGSNALENRTDAIVLTFNDSDEGVIEAIKGDFGAGFEAPIISSENQILLTTIDVPNSTSQPSNIAEIIIFDENKTGLEPNTASAVSTDPDAYSQSVCISVTDFTTGQSFRVKGVNDFDPTVQDSLLFAIKSSSGKWENNGTIKIALIDDSDTIVSQTIIIDSKVDNSAGNPFAFNSKYDNWQVISIPVNALAPTANVAKGIVVLKDDNRGTDSFKLDLIRMQSGLEVADTSMFVEEAPINGKEYNRKNGTWVEDVAGGGNYLPLAGGTMSGDINMDTNKIILSDLYGDIQSIEGTADGQILISSDAYELRVATDAGMYVDQTISANGGILTYSYLKFINAAYRQSTINNTNVTANRDYEMPDKSGTFALLDDINTNGLVPYTGAIGNVQLGDNKIYANAAIADVVYGTYNLRTGSMFSINHQAIEPANDINSLSITASTDKWRVISNSAGNVKAVNFNFDLVPIDNDTSNALQYSLPASSGTLALISDIADTINLQEVTDIGNTTTNNIITAGIESTGHHIFNQDTYGIASFAIRYNAANVLSMGQTHSQIAYIQAEGSLLRIYCDNNNVDIANAVTSKTPAEILALGDTALITKEWVDAAVPASATSTGTKGQMAADADYLYRCVATDTWKRVALSTW